jgi:hypothetical protein
MEALLNRRIVASASILALIALPSVSGLPGDDHLAFGPVGKAAKLPFVIFGEKDSPSNHYVPSGWMGNFKCILLDDGCRTQPHSGATCLRFEYQAARGWSGVVWQDPVDDWGRAPGGWNLTGAKRLVFWARGDEGGEVVSFRFGVLGADKRFYDTDTGSLDAVPLTPTWKEYSIDVSGKDLSCIKTGFAWLIVGQGRPVVFYLDDIRFE